jgi:hypothetical protein
MLWAASVENAAVIAPVNAMTVDRIVAQVEHAENHERGKVASN